MSLSRASEEKQVLFELPESWTNGTVTLTTTRDPNNLIFEIDEANNNSSRTVSFNSVGGICIDIIPVLPAFGAESGGLRDLRSRTFARVRSILPTDDLFWLTRGGTPKSKPFTGEPYNFLEGDDVTELLYHWWHDFVFASDPPHCEGLRTIRTGVVGNAARFGISSGAASNIFYLQVEGGVPENAPRGASGLAHEVGHQLGQGLSDARSRAWWVPLMDRMEVIRISPAEPPPVPWTRVNATPLGLAHDLVSLQQAS